MSTGYPGVPTGIISSLREATHALQQIAVVVNGLLQGKQNNVTTLTLTANAASTVVTDPRAGAGSHISLTPTTANASAEIGAGTIYVSSRGKQTYTVTHANNAQTDRVFTVEITG